jgi:DNA uptake protein ComE-like DNA-binding protein
MMNINRFLSKTQRDVWRLLTLGIVSVALLLGACAPSSSIAELVLDPTRVPISTATPQAGSSSAASANTTSSSATASTPTSEETTSNAALVSGKLNLNTAASDDFLTIPGMTSRMVREFLEYRPYSSILQFRQEIGKYVSDEQVAAYEAYIFVPIDPNNADAATLQQLPGVDASSAAALIAARPYASTQAFLDALTSILNTDQLAVARTYLVTE